MKTYKIDEYLEKSLKWNSVDLFYAYCEARGIGDPENDLTDEQYAKMEDEFQEKVNYKFLMNLIDAITQDVNERILYAME